MAALNTQDPAQRGAAMELFCQQYPNSIVKTDALEQAMAAYQQAGTAAKVEDIANRILQLDPQNIRALAIATAIARSKATQTANSPVATARLRSLAEGGAKELPGWPKPEGISDAEFAKMRNQMGEIFYGAMGFALLQQKDYLAAQDAYLKSVQIEPNNLQDVYQLGIAALESTPLNPKGFWYIARSSSLAQGNSAAQQSINTYGSAKYRRYHGSADGWDQIVTSAATQTALPGNFASSIKPAPSPAELAVTAVQENDPATLSFSDWEYVLGFRDSSAANKQAADRVWQAILEKEKNGQAKLKLPVKVMSATTTQILAAITDENQKANKADLDVSLQKPMLNPPSAGAQLDVIGVLTDYQANPFVFYMKQAQVAPAQTK